MQMDALRKLPDMINGNRTRETTLNIFYVNANFFVRGKYSEIGQYDSNYYLLTLKNQEKEDYLPNKKNNNKKQKKKKKKKKKTF